MNSVDGREVLHCECGLVQFRTANGQCRRCHAPFESPEPVSPPIAEESAPPIKLRGFEPNSPRHDILGESFASVLRLIRQAKGLSQDDLAQISGFERTYVSKVECNHALPTVSNILRICKALELNPQAFVTAVEIGAQ